MKDEERLEQIKIRMGLNGNTYNDALLKELIIDVMQDLRDIGISEEVLQSSSSLGVITTGVKDLWTNNPSETKHSQYFYERADRLRRKVTSNEL